MMQNKLTAIVNADVFDGNEMIGKRSVIFQNGKIIDISGNFPTGAEIIDGTGCTLMPGLIDSHVHTSEDSLRDAILFGVTTELEMQGSMTKRGRELQLKNKHNISDVRSAGMALTAPGGHPDELIPKEEGIPGFILKKMSKMSQQEKEDFLKAFEEREKEDGTKIDVTTVEGAVEFVIHQVESGADYFKIMIEEGTVMNAPGLPMLKPEVLKAAVNKAHQLGKIAIAHVLTAEAAKTAVEVGVDGLAHLFIDRPAWTSDLIKSIADKGIFVSPCLVLNSSIIGNSACSLAHDYRVKDKLSQDWKNTLCSCFHTFPEANMDDNFKNVKDLHDAGVDILVGTDVSVPMPHLGGLAHGVSVHHEMQMLVEAGLSPIEALRSATSIPARRFSLHDRGKIDVGLRADLVLVKGNPAEQICDSLSIISVWKEGIAINLNVDVH